MADDTEQRAGKPERRRWAVAAVTLAVNLGSFLFLVLVARSASAATFGALAALAGITLLFEVPANALQVAIAHTVGTTGGPGPEKAAGQPPTVFAGPLLVEATIWGAVLCAVLLALSPLVESFLHLPSITSALLLAAYALPVSTSMVPKGVLVGQGRLALLASGLIGGTVVRLVSGVLLVRHGAGLDGALAAMVWGEVVTGAVTLVGLRQLLSEPKSPGAAEPVGAGEPVGGETVGGETVGGETVGGETVGGETVGGETVGGETVGGETVSTGVASETTGAGEPTTEDLPLRLRWGDAKAPAVAFTGYWLLTAIDVVLARHWLGTVASGWYAAAATTAQIALIAPAAVAAVTFPRLVGSEVPRLVGPDSRPNQRLMFALGSAVVAATGLAAAVVVSLLAPPTVRALFGQPYAPAGGVVGLLTFSGALLGLVTVLLHYHLSRGVHVPASLCWPGIVVVVVGTALWHRSMIEIAVVMIVATAAVCATMLVIAYGHTEGPRTGLVQRANLALLDANLDLTVVVPYYNPGKLLVPTMERLLQVLDASGASYEVIAVSDGSTDGSDHELDAALAGRPQLRNVVLARNQGKGAALRIGLASGHGRYLGFIDADGDLDPLLLDSFQAMVRVYSPDIILGSKRHPLSEVEYPFLRRVYSWGYQQVVRAGFRLNIRDTQTGIKLVRRDVLAAVLPRMVEKRFAFDLELFVIARRLGYKRFLEAPIRLRHQFTSTVSWRSVYRSLLDTMAIWYRLRILHFYDGDQAPATPGGERVRIDPVLLRGGAGGSAGASVSPGPGTGLATAGGAGPTTSEGGAGWAPASVPTSQHRTAQQGPG
jgi:glycosyltransferase involved in cell wall biosynthesis/O-antigen/teichoic acid export membrane protein